jgi:hypothetical protein
MVHRQGCLSNEQSIAPALTLEAIVAAVRCVIVADLGRDIKEERPEIVSVCVTRSKRGCCWPLD